MTPNTLLSILAANVLFIGVIYYFTYKSNIHRDSKIAVYLVTFLVPILGLIILLIFKRNERRAKESS